MRGMLVDLALRLQTKTLPKSRLPKAGNLHRGSLGQAEEREERMIKMWDRYEHDPLFRRLVDLMHGVLEEGTYTPTEIREAAMLAQILHEDRHPRPITFTRDEVLRGKV